MRNYLNGRIGRTSTRVLFVAAVAVAGAVAVGQSAFAADKVITSGSFCYSYDPEMGYYDTVCPFSYGGSGNASQPAPPVTVAVSASRSTSFAEPGGTLTISTGGGVMRTGTSALRPSIFLNTVFSNTSSVAVTGCVDVVAKDGATSVWDSGTTRISVAAKNSYTESDVTNVTIALAGEITSFTVDETLC